eukprot:scaffold1469_cov119-Cylindrotheca_fusiformis.AAC.14
MSELDMCSRREADRWIRQGRIRIHGQLAAIAEQVPSDLSKDSIHIQGMTSDDDEDTTNNSVTTTTTTTAVVLNKPPGYVSGQAEHGHPPAIRLLTRDRLWESNDFNVTNNNNNNKKDRTVAAASLLPSSWRGFAPAGRLDRNSTGLLVFTSSGVIAKKLIHHSSSAAAAISKEYMVEVQPAEQVTRKERQMDPSFELPQPPLMDLSPLIKGGRTLLGSSNKPLLPCVDAEWIQEGKILRLVLTEGRKHHIRRLCREILGFHVIQLQRIRIGPILLNDLPEGCWRPLTQDELDGILLQ